MYKKLQKKTCEKNSAKIIYVEKILENIAQKIVQKCVKIEIVHKKMH